MVGSGRVILSWSTPSVTARHTYSKVGGIAAEHAAQRDEGTGPVILIFVCVPVGSDGEGDLERAGHDYDPVKYSGLVEYSGGSLLPAR